MDDKAKRNKNKGATRVARINKLSLKNDKTKPIEINEKLIDHLAKLSKLSPNLDKADKTTLKFHLTSIITMFNKLDQVDVPPYKVMMSVDELFRDKQKIREDEAKSDLEPQRFLETATEYEQDSFIVPRILSNSDDN